MPEIAKLWDYEKNDIGPDEVTTFSHKKFWWLCRHGKSYKTKIGGKKLMDVSVKT